VTRRNDQVFQLSLTEIAFTLIFILLLLLGYLVVREQTEKEAALAALAEAKSAEASATSMEAAKAELVKALAGVGGGKNAPSMDEVISRLTASQDAKAEAERLKRQVEDLDAQLSAMTEVKKLLEAAANEQNVESNELAEALTLQQEVLEALAKTETGGQATGEKAGTKPGVDPQVRREQHKKALAQVQHAITTTDLLRVALKKQLDQDLAPGKEAQTVDSVIAAAKAQAESTKKGMNLETATKENSDLRGQVAFFKRRLEARGGRDYPPCWATESGSAEYLFSVELTPGGVQVKPSWPASREADAKALPGMDDALQSPVPMEAFVRNVQGIFNSSKKADPQCRHYVYLKSSIVEAAASDRARLTVENYFYKSEARR
jgi:hypothetical protein